MYASVDDEFSWQEWNFENYDEFESNIIEHISNRVNRTIKTVIPKEKHKSYAVSVYYLDQDTNDWILIENGITEDKLVYLLAADKNETTETVKTYKLESQPAE